jgi:uncharacterized protein (DUF1501 family)
LFDVTKSLVSDQFSDFQGTLCGKKWFLEFLSELGNKRMLSHGESMATTVSKGSWLQRVWWGLMSNTQDSAGDYRMQRSLQTTTLKVVRLQQQVAQLQSQHNAEMMRLARSYQDLSGEQRQSLSPLLKQQLDKIEAEYF